jgi:hypothetical protein
MATVLATSFVAPAEALTVGPSAIAVAQAPTLPESEAALNRETRAASELRSGDVLEAQGFLQLKTLKVDERTGQVLSESFANVISGETMTILSAPMLTPVGAFVKVGLDVEDTDVEAEVWVRVADLTAGRLLTKLEEGEIDEAVALGDTDLFAATEVASRRGQRGRRRGVTLCYRYVKLYLLRTGKVRTYLPGGSAYMAAGVLPRHGFRRTGTGPGGARVGDVCVYRGGRHGHIEVLTSGGWYYGYGYKSAPISNRRFVACFRK